MIATSSFLTVLECTKFVFGHCSPDPLGGLRGPTSKGRGKEGRGKRERRRGEEGNGRDRPPAVPKFLDPP